jgi:hypothetical protein
MAVNDSQTVTIVVTATAAGAAVNTATVTADQSDPNGANNASAVTTAVGELCAGIDLTSTWNPDIKIRSKTRKGVDQFTLTANYTVENIGTECAGKTGIAFYLSSTGQIDGSATQLAVRRVKALCHNGTQTKTVKLKLPAGVNPNGMFLVAYTDSAFCNPECDEQNNTQPIQIGEGF